MKVDNFNIYLFIIYFISAIPYQTVQGENITNINWNSKENLRMNDFQNNDSCRIVGHDKYYFDFGIGCIYDVDSGINSNIMCDTLNFKVYSFMDNMTSYLCLNSDSLLLLAQCEFDIVELYTRKLKELISNNIDSIYCNPRFLDKLYKKVSMECSEKIYFFENSIGELSLNEIKRSKKELEIELSSETHYKYSIFSFVICR